MKKGLIFFYCALITSLLMFAGCTDPNRIIDQNTEVPDHNWTYLNRFGFAVKIEDTQQAYTVYMNLRVTGDYKYSNLFVLISQTGPDKKTTEPRRYEMKLANKDGEWLGKGSGNLYSYLVPFLINYKFPAKGTYTFVIEQNMRDNPLREVSDVGLRVEKATP
ncbi:gliding motility lipoprotein GldH [Mucilaginibacter xinganensis]|uniref:Gliding motility lipoprotein GldH n=1 Tax=Mucilaginibacter xinganensis TaxID=1234841 RepID=A0A223NQR4_9SPHI|nr:gliding motility lipoprotein GldH [Mucilaginibacter xinganensis]ASU32213.1 gliding motility lipoprotein GldH [Mucilaginibacter xinganensis]